MELKRKQRALRQKFWFRVGVCAVSLVGVILYLGLNNNSALWGTVIGICGSALVWALVELFDFFIQTFYEYETERNVFLGIKTECFGKMKNIIRQSLDDIPMHDIKACAVELYNRMNEFIFSAGVYPISREFEECTNYVERMFWKFDSCCSGFFDNCEEKKEYYEKMRQCLIEENEVKEPTSARFFHAFTSQKTIAKMTDITLSFEKFSVPKDIFEEGVAGNLGETFSIPGNVRTTTTFKPDADFWHLHEKSNSKLVCTVLSLVFRKVAIN